MYHETVKLSITGITSDGDGVGRHNDMAIFVPFAVPGDEITADITEKKKNYARAELVSVNRPAKGRITPDCAVFGSCGGCVFRNIDYTLECEIKSNKVADALVRIGGIDVKPDEILHISPDGYRNKAQYPINSDGKTGFFERGSHKIIPCGECLLQPRVFSDIACAVGLWIKQYGISVYNDHTGKGLLRHLYLRVAKATGQIMVVLVINGESLPHADTLIYALRAITQDKLQSAVLNINRRRTNVILGDTCKTIYKDGYITDVICGVKLRISPLSFCQVNHDMAELLYTRAAEYAAPVGKTVIDLYCGAGAIGLSMAKKAKKIIGVEIVPQAVEDARYNAKLNCIENAEFICSDAADAAEQLKKRGETADVVIVDPPRKGCEERLLETVACGFSPQTIVYVSCDPATLARDCKYLSQRGYSVTKVTPADLFPRTAHVETVVLLTRAQDYKRDQTTL